MPKLRRKMRLCSRILLVAVSICCSGSLLLRRLPAKVSFCVVDNGQKISGARFCRYTSAFFNRLRGGQDEEAEVAHDWRGMQRVYGQFCLYPEESTNVNVDFVSGNDLDEGTSAGDDDEEDFVLHLPTWLERIYELNLVFLVRRYDLRCISQ